MPGNCTATAPQLDRKTAVSGTRVAPGGGRIVTKETGERRSDAVNICIPRDAHGWQRGETPAYPSSTRSAHEAPTKRPLGVHSGVCSTEWERARTRCRAMPGDGPGKYKLNFYPEVRWSSTSYNLYITNPEYEVARGLTTVLGSAGAAAPRTQWVRWWSGGLEG